MQPNAWSPLALSVARYGVFRVHDDGRRELVTPIGTYLQADETAGAMRDEMTDEERADGWNYLPGKV